MDEQTPLEPQPPAPAKPAPDQTYGCLTAALALAIFGCLAALGFIWVASLLPGIPGAGTLVVYALRAGGYGLLLIIPFGAAAIFLRQERFALWRGLALAPAIAGGHAALIGGVQAINHAGRTPGLPYWLPSLLSVIYSLGVIASGRRRFLARPAPGALILGAALGLIVSVGWLWVGTLGTLIEIGLSILDALSTALIAAVLVRALFFYDEEMPTRRPFWSALLVGAAFLGMLYGLLAVRGYALQGSTLATALLPAGVIAGALLTFDDQPDPTRMWWAVFAFLFCLFLIPFTWSEGFEGDYMFEDLGPAWGPAILVSLMLALVIGIALLVARRWLVKNLSRLVIPASLAGFAVILSAAVYFGVGRPGVQAETFFVVLKDQADTTPAATIKDLTQRRQTVYQTLTTQAEKSQAGLRALLDTQHVTYRPYYLVNGIEVFGNPLIRAQIAARPDVARILDSPHARSLPAFTQGIGIPGNQIAPTEPGWNIQQIKADQVWRQYGITGTGVVIGSADTGVDWTHPAIRGQYLGSEGQHDYTWYDPWYGHAVPDDGEGHGTHTTGIVLGQGGIGVAPGAKWIACRNLGRNLGNPPVYLACMQFLFAPFPLKGDAFRDGDPRRGADVVNNSWGCPAPEGCDAITLSIAIDHLYHAGQMYVVSAGNDGPECATVDPPANAEHSLSVGAIQEGGTITDFSSRGPITADGSGRIKPDVAAPGADVVSSVPHGGYVPLAGTSMAGPHVTGLVALLWSANPALRGNIDRTAQIIEQTAQHESAPSLCGATGEDQNNVYGWGDVDALAAVKMALGK
jgi:uncharacterized protein YdbL (DUF1318 family)